LLSFLPLRGIAGSPLGAPVVSTVQTMQLATGWRRQEARLLHLAAEYCDNFHLHRLAVLAALHEKR
jgi:hypothetical protein